MNEAKRFLHLFSKFVIIDVAGALDCIEQFMISIGIYLDSEDSTSSASK